jgi:hypothetical protein
VIPREEQQKMVGFFPRSRGVEDLRSLLFRVEEKHKKSILNSSTPQE